MLSGSVVLRGLRISSGSALTTNVVAALSAATPLTSPVIQAPTSLSTGMMFQWAVPEGNLGVHKLGDRLHTTLSAHYGDMQIENYKISAGALPPTILLHSDNGVLSGTFEQAGQYRFTIRATVDHKTSDASYNLTVK